MYIIYKIVELIIEKISLVVEDDGCCDNEFTRRRFASSILYLNF